MCHTVCYLLLHCHVLYSLLFVAALLHAVQFAICCCMPYSLVFVAACRIVWYLLPHAVQFAICCRMPYSLLFVAACHSVCCMFYSLLLTAACRTCSHSSPCGLQFALFATQSSIIWGRLGAVNCLATGSTSNHNGLSDKVHCHKM